MPFLQFPPYQTDLPCKIRPGLKFEGVTGDADTFLRQAFSSLPSAQTWQELMVQALAVRQLVLAVQPFKHLTVVVDADDDELVLCVHAEPRTQSCTVNLSSDGPQRQAPLQISGALALPLAGSLDRLRVELQIRWNRKPMLAMKWHHPIAPSLPLLSVLSQRAPGAWVAPMPGSVSGSLTLSGRDCLSRVLLDLPTWAGYWCSKFAAQGDPSDMSQLGPGALPLQPQTLLDI